MWPMIVEQRLNVKLVADEFGVGLRIGEGNGVVGWEVVEKMVRELEGGSKEEGEDIGRSSQECCERRWSVWAIAG